MKISENPIFTLPENLDEMTDEQKAIAFSVASLLSMSGVLDVTEQISGVKCFFSAVKAIEGNTLDGINELMEQAKSCTCGRTAFHHALEIVTEVSAKIQLKSALEEMAASKQTNTPNPSGNPYKN